MFGGVSQPKLADGTRPPSPSGFGGQPSLRFASEGWWSRSGSNRRPQACKARALPTELRPRFRKVSWLASATRSLRGGTRPPSPKWLRRAPIPCVSRKRRVVGPGGVEPPTSRLSGVRSNHLSYEPFSESGPFSAARYGSVCTSQPRPLRAHTPKAQTPKERSPKHRRKRANPQVPSSISDVLSGKGDVDGGEAMP
jgi:hypothetical protein